MMDAQECPKCSLNTKSFVKAVDECSSFRLGNDSLAVTALLQCFSAVNLLKRNGGTVLRLLSLLWAIRCVHCMTNRCDAFLIHHPEIPVQRDIQGRIYKEIYWVE